MYFGAASGNRIIAFYIILYKDKLSQNLVNKQVVIIYRYRQAV